MPARLAAAITQAATNIGMRERARLLGEKIRAEDGVGRAIEAFHRYVRAWVADAKVGKSVRGQGTLRRRKG